MEPAKDAPGARPPPPATAQGPPTQQQQQPQRPPSQPPAQPPRPAGMAAAAPATQPPQAEAAKPKPPTPSQSPPLGLHSRLGMFGAPRQLPPVQQQPSPAASASSSSGAAGQPSTSAAPTTAAASSASPQPQSQQPQPGAGPAPLTDAQKLEQQRREFGSNPYAKLSFPHRWGAPPRQLDARLNGPYLQRQTPTSSPQQTAPAPAAGLYSSPGATQAKPAGAGAGEAPKQWQGLLGRPASAAQAAGPPGVAAQSAAAGEAKAADAAKPATEAAKPADAAESKPVAEQQQRAYPPLPSAFARESPYSTATTDNKGVDDSWRARPNVPLATVRPSMPPPSAAAAAHRDEVGGARSPPGSLGRGIFQQQPKPPTFPPAHSSTSASTSGHSRQPSAGAPGIDRSWLATEARSGPQAGHQPGATAAQNSHSAASTSAAATSALKVSAPAPSPAAPARQEPIHGLYGQPQGHLQQQQQAKTAAADQNAAARAREQEGLLHKRKRSEVGGAFESSHPTPPPAKRTTPLFTQADVTKNALHPPLLKVKSFLPTDNHKGSLGRFYYDPFVPTASLLNGEVLRDNVGGLVEVSIASRWLGQACHVGSPKLEDLEKGVLVPRSGELGALAYEDLEPFRRRDLWGTDAYTDDSDVFAIAVHSGWIRFNVSTTKGKAPATALEAKPGAQQSLLVKLRVAPALIRYQGSTRQGIKSRSWGNGHDGVTLVVEDVVVVDESGDGVGHRRAKQRAGGAVAMLSGCRERPVTLPEPVRLDWAPTPLR